jgi:hypothetical protein
MSDEPQSPNSPVAGPADAAPWAQGQADAAPEPASGQAQAPHGQDPGQAPSTPATGEPTFFDPAQVPPELLPAYKQMQAAFTTKTQDLARQRQKIDAYDAFMQDPVGQMQRLASQYGLNLSRAEAAQAIQGQASAQDWNPQSWDEVLAKAEERAEERVLRRLQPYLGRLQEMQAGQIETQLQQIDPQWRQYEGQMRTILQRHPSLVNDVAMLYRMAVPPEALEAKAIQAALKKYEGKAGHQDMSKSTASRSKPGPAKISSFEDAVAEARRQIQSGEV